MSCAYSFSYKDKHYNSLKEFCEENHITRERMYNDYYRHFEFDNPPIEAHGKYFETYTELCLFFKISLSAFHYEKNKHQTLTEVVDYLLNKQGSRGIYSKDFLGNEFSSSSALCLFWVIKPSLFCKRLDRGYTIEEAITGRIKAKKKAFYQKNKDKFSSKEEFDYYLNQITKQG